MFFVNNYVIKKQVWGNDSVRGYCFSIFFSGCNQNQIYPHCFFVGAKVRIILDIAKKTFQLMGKK